MLAMQMIEEIFSRHATQYGAQVRQSPGIFKSYVRLAIQDCSGPQPTTDEAESVIRGWFKRVFLDYGMDSPIFEVAVPLLARELLQHLATHTAAPARESQSETAARRRLIIEPKLKAKGYTANRWAKLAGVDSQTAYRFLEGETKPNPDTCRLLAEVLGMSVNDFPA